MNLVVSIQRPIAGLPVTHSMHLDGEAVECGRVLSEKLTGAVIWGCTNGGIFEHKATLRKSPAFIEIDFGGELVLEHYSNAQDFVDEVRRRCLLVEEAFTAKYPVHSSTATLVIAAQASSEATLEILGALPDTVFA